MLLQSTAPTAAGRAHRTPSSSSIRRVQPIVAPRRLIIADAALKDTAAVPVMEKGELSVFPEQPAVYAVYDKEGAVQYIGLTRKVRWIESAVIHGVVLLHAYTQCAEQGSRQQHQQQQPGSSVGANFSTSTSLQQINVYTQVGFNRLIS